MSTLRRRTILAGALGAPFATLAAPAVHAQGGKPYAGTTINGSCFQTTYFEYLKNYFPQFEEKTGIKVNFTMQAFPVYNQRTDLELSTKGSAIDVCNVTFIYSGRWIGAGWFTNLDTFTKDTKYTPADWEPEDFAGGPQSAMKNAKGETFGFTWEGRRDDHDRLALRPDREGGARHAQDLRRADQGVRRGAQQGGRRGLHRRQAASLELDPLPDGHGRQRVQGAAGEPDADPRHAAGREVGRLVRQPADEVRAGRPAVLFRRPGDALADVGPRQHAHPGDHLGRAAGQACREHGAEDGALRPDAGRTEGQLPRLEQPRPRHPGRLEEEGGGLGVHQVGAVEGDDRHGRRRSTAIPASAAPR